MAETSNIAEMANKISSELFKWFKWNRLNLMDQNFLCMKQDKHKPKNKNAEHTHPVDVVFHYMDPYLNKRILLNTDLKSYAKSTVADYAKLRESLKSLARTIECARISQDWKEKYSIFTDTTEIRGMLFIYNHSGDYDRNFYDVFKKNEKDPNKCIKIESIPLVKNQQIHIISPLIINYMTTIISDMQRLHQEGTFPSKNYYFHYPDLSLHRVHGSRQDRPATVELICSPYLIIEHDDIIKCNEDSGVPEITYPKGYVIYYNKPGSSSNEFLYLLDTLSKYQILDTDKCLRIRVAFPSYSKNIRSNFKAAIERYIRDWGFNEEMHKKLNKIEFSVIEITKTVYCQTEIGWRLS